MTSETGASAGTKPKSPKSPKSPFFPSWTPSRAAGQGWDWAARWWPSILSAGGGGGAEKSATLTAADLKVPTPLADVALTLCTMCLGVGSIYYVSYLANIGILDREVLKLSLSLACPLITIVSYVAPTPMVIEAVLRMNAQRLPTLVFQSQAACNVLGIAYAIQVTNAAVLMTNMFGLACQILFLAGDHHATASSAHWLWFCFKVSVCLNVGIYVFACQAPTQLLGQCISVFNIILYSAPFANLGSILRTRNGSYFNSVTTSISVANNAAWTLYALLIEDVVVLLPAVVGYTLSVFQVLVIMWCRGSLPFDLGFLLQCLGDRRGAAKPGSDDQPGGDLEDVDAEEEQYSPRAGSKVAPWL
eukprot:CAMPEP_0115095476 /NCGR_PEP_ID=MMETSP0227-20121206/29061_1 /TAXON_ID=89957 /ORGANISM="Polarella glacialis, Strain CCMP 1383" /LENGTH=359 /DNA_ID=CAMNT_0002488847 /DNA_START=117 /DNA_END=1196 /DNA_ORIENTATION=+